MEFMRRFGTLALAGLFILTSVAFTVVLFWSQGQDNANSDLTPEQQQMIQQQLNQTQDTPDSEGNNMLQGTKLDNFTAVDSAVTELQIIDLTEGSGDVVPEGATITAHYTGAIANTGEIFQSSKDMGEAIQFSLNGVIAGWTEGVPGMKVGGKRRLIIPADMAYGPAPAGYVFQQGSTPQGDLVFDIELVSID